MKLIDKIDKFLDGIEEDIHIRIRRRKFRRMVLNYKKMRNVKRKKINHTPFALPTSRHKHKSARK